MVGVSTRSQTEARRAAWMILGLLAIPVLSVTSAALVADAASSTDPVAAVVGIPATLGGLLMGALVFRLARVVHSGAVALRAHLLGAGVGALGVVAEAVRPRSVSAERRPSLVLVPARVGRRGPPRPSM